MALSLEDINLLVQYGFSQFEVAAMDETEETSTLNAIKGIDDSDPDGAQNNKRIWGLENAHE